MEYQFRDKPELQQIQQFRNTIETRLNCVSELLDLMNEPKPRCPGTSHHLKTCPTSFVMV